MLKKVIDLLKIVVNKYELKHPEYAKPVFIWKKERTYLQKRFRKLSRR